MRAYFALQPRHRQFVDLLFLGKTRTEAARVIAPHIKRPDQLGWKLWNHPRIKAVCEEMQLELQNDFKTRAIAVLDRAHTKALDDTEKEQLGFIRLVLQFHNLLTERHEHSGPKGEPIPVQSVAAVIVANDRDEALAAYRAMLPKPKSAPAA